MKNSKGNAAITTILVVVILLLLGFIVYDKVLLKDDNKDINTNKIETIKTNIVETENVESTEFYNNNFQAKGIIEKDGTITKDREYVNDEKKHLVLSNKDFVGHYEGETLYKYNNDYEMNQSYALDLYKDGTFRYEFGEESHSFILGNFFLEGNEIKLNYIFMGSSSMAGQERGFFGSNTLIIIDKNTIKDTKSEITGQEVTLKRVELEQDEHGFSNGLLYDYLIKNSFLIEEY